eukprot:TRINITY_DN10094_c0_g1_i1.p1 TRINITY_DN10094_c0_g1~~TRINITY_DN10094_c0_g1_i1.p1  ORF type:complete len:428 (-),score=61.81 TRINITY_DN10094_c0_g1_i1:375-1658(-)
MHNTHNTHNTPMAIYGAVPLRLFTDDLEAEPILANKDKQRTTATIPSAIFNLSNATIGADVLGLPFLVRECGLVFGLFMIVSFGLVANYTLNLLHQCGTQMLTRPLLNNNNNTHTHNDNNTHNKFSRTRAYEDIAEDLYGFRAATLVKCIVISLNFGGVISYLIIIGDMLLSSFLTQVTSIDAFYVQRWFVVAVVTVCVLLPLSCNERMSSLYWPSLLSLLSVVSFTLIVVGYYFFGQTEQSGELVLFRIRLSIFQVLGVLTFAYSVHTTLLPVAKDFAVPTGMRTAIRGAVAISAVSYVLIGAFGYLSFYENTKGDLVLSYKSKDFFIDFIKIIMAVSICLTTPTIVYPYRLSLDNLLFPSHQSPHRWLALFFEYPRYRLVCETVAILGTGYICATAIPSVTVVFSLTGSTASTLTSRRPCAQLQV